MITTVSSPSLTLAQTTMTQTDMPSSVSSTIDLVVGQNPLNSHPVEDGSTLIELKCLVSIKEAMHFLDLEESTMEQFTCFEEPPMSQVQLVQLAVKSVLVLKPMKHCVLT